MLVVISHIPNISSAVGLPFFRDAPIFQRGTEAVLVFFTLSGYLIIGLLFDEKKRNGSINIRNFYVRRMLRLYPVYFLVLFFGLAFYHYFLPVLGIPYNESYSLTEGILWNVGFFPNIFIKLYDPGSILLVLWSIGIEEQFYLVIAPLLYFISLNHYFKSITAFTIGYFILFHSSFFSFFKEYSFLYFFISAGGIIAILDRHGIPLHFKSIFLRFMLYLVFILNFTTDWFLFKDEIIKSAFEVVLFSLLIVNIVVDNNILKRFKLMNYIGKISYGIYLYHMILINLVLFVFLKINNAFKISSTYMVVLIYFTSILVTVLFSHLSYRYFETYFLSLKNKFRN